MSVTNVIAKIKSQQKPLTINWGKIGGKINDKVFHFQT